MAGLVAGNALLGEPLTNPDLLRLATAIEGHPDNATAALLGGFTACAVVDGTVEALRFDAPRDLRAVLFIPDLRLPTAEMRSVLPKKVPLDDAVANLTRVAIGVAGLATGRYDLLRVLTVDRLHEPYRAAVYPQLPQLIAAAREAGAIGACLSGAGSTVVAFSRFGSDDHPCRGGVCCGRRRHRPHRPHLGRVATEPRCPGDQPPVSPRPGCAGPVQSGPAQLTDA